MPTTTEIRARLTQWGFNHRGSLTEDAKDFQVWFHNKARMLADGTIDATEWRALAMDDANYGTAPVKGVRCNYRWGIRNSAYAAGYHTGDDWAAPTGEFVYSTRSGTVTRVGTDSAYGRFVVVRSTVPGASLDIWYCHLSVQSVRVGQTVRFDQKVGEVGATGNTTGPHLHYEERGYPYAYANNRKPRLDRHPHSALWAQ